MAAPNERSEAPRLTEQQIEQWRLDLRDALGERYPSIDDMTREVHWNKVDAICDMALASLRSATAPQPATATHPDTERMNWLERFVVNVRTPLVHGSSDLFWSSPTEVEGADDEPSDIRAQIDYQRNGGRRPPDKTIEREGKDGT